MADLLLVMAAHERANKEDLEAVFMKVRAMVRATTLRSVLLCESSSFRVPIVNAVFLASLPSTTSDNYTPVADSHVTPHLVTQCTRHSLIISQLHPLLLLPPLSPPPLPSLPPLPPLHSLPPLPSPPPPPPLAPPLPLLSLLLLLLPFPPFVHAVCISTEGW